jgi:hypothetical protein
MTNPAENPNQYVLDEAMGYVYAAALRAVTVLGVAGHLGDGPCTVAELAGLTGSHGQSLRRVLRLLATREIFREDDDGRFHLTPRAEVLRPDVPGTIHPGVLAVTSEVFWQSIADLADAVRHGEPAFDRRFGLPFFDYLHEHPDVGATFNAGMANFTEGEFDRVVSGYDFPDDGVLVDVGGGFGGLLLAILRARPGLRGVLLDREQVVAGSVLGQLGADDRWETVAGDFFDAVPPGDFYTLKNILHDWTDDQCVRVLTNCRRAMRPGAKLLAVEVVLPSGNEPHFGKVMDVFIMQLLPGQERTSAEFEDIFTRAGFRIIRVIPTSGALSLIEAEPSSW